MRKGDYPKRAISLYCSIFLYNWLCLQLRDGSWATIWVAMYLWPAAVGCGL